MSLIRSLLWFALFMAFTFVFTVIFEHGFMNFAENSRHELDLFRGYLSPGSVKRPDDKSDKVVP